MNQSQNTEAERNDALRAELMFAAGAVAQCGFAIQKLLQNIEGALLGVWELKAQLEAQQSFQGPPLVEAHAQIQHITAKIYASLTEARTVDCKQLESARQHLEGLYSMLFGRKGDRVAGVPSDEGSLPEALFLNPEFMGVNNYPDDSEGFSEGSEHSSNTTLIDDEIPF